MSYEILEMCKKYYNMRGVISVCAMVRVHKAIIIITLMTDLG